MSKKQLAWRQGEQRRGGRCPSGPAYAVAASLPLLLGGCVTDAQFLAQNAPSAQRAAEIRGKFELDCQTVRTEVRSQQVIQGKQGGPDSWRGSGMGAYAGPWTQFTIGVRGCGREAVYTVVCGDENDCNAFPQATQTTKAPK